MKKSILLAISCTLIHITSIGQVIPNGDFETWVYTPLFSLDPEDWQTMNGQIILSAERDSAAYEGDFAMKVHSIPNGMGEEGIASIQVPVSAIPPSLDFHAKWDRTLSCAVGVELTFYNGEFAFYSESWYPEEENSDWTPISIPLDQIEPIMTHVEIRVVVYIGDLVPGDGWISVDAMSFSTVNSLSESDGLQAVRIYPNPVSEQLIIDRAGLDSEYVIYDEMGRQVQKGIYLEGVPASSLNQGLYVIQLRKKDGEVLKRKFQVQR